MGLSRLGCTAGDQAVLRACYRALFAGGKEAALAALSELSGGKAGNGEETGPGRLAEWMGDFFGRQSRGILLRTRPD